MKLFISYTGDLVDESQAVKEAVSRCATLTPVDVFDYQTEGPASESVLQRLEKEIRRSDLYMLFLGAEYGTVCTDAEGRTLSYTEFEYRQAQRCWESQQRPEIISFLKQGTPEPEPQQQALIRAVEDRHVYQTYESLSEVRYWVCSTLTNRLVRVEQQLDPANHKSSLLIYLLAFLLSFAAIGGYLIEVVDFQRAGIVVLACIGMLVLAKFFLDL